MNLQEKKLYGGEATNATSRLVEHVTNKKGSEVVELIELATLISQLDSEIKKLEKEIGVTINIKQKNELTTVYNKAIDELRKAHELQAQKTKKEWNHVLPKKMELLPEERVEVTPIITEEKPVVTVNNSVEENKITQLPKTNEDSVVSNIGPGTVTLSNQNQRGEPNTIVSGDMEGEKSSDVGAVTEKESSVITDETGENVASSHTKTTVTETGELSEQTQDDEKEVITMNVSGDELMKQLAVQMEMMLEIDRKIAEIKQENLEIEKFIAEQEKIEGEKILAEEWAKLKTELKKIKKMGVKKDDIRLQKYDKKLIEEVYGKGK